MKPATKLLLYLPALALLSVPLLYSLANPQKTEMEVFLRFWWAWLFAALYGIGLVCVGVYLSRKRRSGAGS